MPPKHELGLSLSGGGYRAAAFHLGTLKKLNEMNILPRVDVLSTISGGSITGSAWCLYRGDYNMFHNEMIAKIEKKSIIRYVLTSATILIPSTVLVILLLGTAVITFTRISWLTYPILISLFFILYKWQFKIFPFSKIIENAYDKFFFQKKTLADLKNRPIIAINSSNLETGRPFTFSKTKMSDSSYAFRNPPVTFLNSGFPIARAVMASSAVPGAFTPVIIGKEFYKKGSDFDIIKPQLVDGGVYDNQGIQKITQDKSSYECKVIITSDAGSAFYANMKYPNSVALLMRTVNLFMNRIKTSQMIQNIYQNVNARARPVAYFSLDWRVEKLIPQFINNLINGNVLKEILESHHLPPNWLENPDAFRGDIQKHLEDQLGYKAIKNRDLTEVELRIARASGTNLTKLSSARIGYLIRQAENLTELQIKLYCPMIL